MPKKFIKNSEDFVCKKCKIITKGDGYTDHCPACLWSKHVDINPGDRASECGAMMKPVGIKTKKDGYIIYYSCAKCGYKHRVKSARNDNFEEIIKLSKLPLKI